MGDCEINVLHLDDDDVEELRPSPAQEAEKGQIHLLLGDSIPYRMQDRLETSPNDILLNMSQPGNSWAKLAICKADEVTSWKEAAKLFGCELGNCVIWMTGNDVYPRSATAQSHPIRLNDLETNVDEVIGYMWAPARSVLVLGPLPRFKFDAGRYWADSPAFKAQQVTKKVCSEYSVEFLPLGRIFTKSYRKWHLVGEDCQQYFHDDGVHLSTTGEDKILERIPAWLKWRR